MGHLSAAPNKPVIPLESYQVVYIKSLSNTFVKSILFQQSTQNYHEEYEVVFIETSKSSESGCIGWAAGNWPLTGAVPLLTPTGAFGCWVTPLTRFAPP